MKEAIKLYLDENVHPELAVILRKYGYDAIATQETDNCGKSDIEQMDFAASQQRVIVTFNIKDFVPLNNTFYSEDHYHSGIIVSSQINLKTMLKRLLKLLNNKSKQDMENSIEFLNNWK